LSDDDDDDDRAHCLSKDSTFKRCGVCLLFVGESALSHQKNA